MNVPERGASPPSAGRVFLRAFLRVSVVLLSGFALFLLAALMLLPGASDSARLVAACVLSIVAGVAAALVARRLGAR